MSKSKAINMLKELHAEFDGGYYTNTCKRIRDIIDELEVLPKIYPPLFRLDDEFPETPLVQEYRPKCSWCNDYLQYPHPFKDANGNEYCSVACMLTSKDHEILAKHIKYHPS